MNIEPLSIATMPHPGLLRLAGPRTACRVHKLREPDVGYARGVLANQVHVGVEQGGVHGLAVLAQHWTNRKMWKKSRLYIRKFKSLV